MWLGQQAGHLRESIWMSIGVQNSLQCETIVIEDSVAGVLAAKRAGMKVFGFTGGGHAYGSLASRLTKGGLGFRLDGFFSLFRVRVFCLISHPLLNAAHVSLCRSLAFDYADSGPHEYLVQQRSNIPTPDDQTDSHGHHGCHSEHVHEDVHGMLVGFEVTFVRPQELPVALAERGLGG